MGEEKELDDRLISGWQSASAKVSSVERLSLTESMLYFIVLRKYIEPIFIKISPNSKLERVGGFTNLRTA